jgi:4-phospho-D-threonate 3-dehydrogenase / 4-phospho-D-erythronate 3-dehydrogenase
MEQLIAVTMGDAAGIGPEIILKSFREREDIKSNLFVIGDFVVLEKVRSQLGYDDISLNSLTSFNKQDFKKASVNVLDMKLLNINDFIPGRISKSTGDASFRYIEEGIRLANEGSVAAIVTAPICKEAIQMAGHDFAGHTEIFAKYTGSDNYAMLLYHKKFSVIHISTHVPLADAISSLNQTRVETVIRLAQDSMKKILGHNPRIAVAGINPHSGENGLFGRQEIEILKPAVSNMRSEGIDVSGPYPPDTVFLHALQGRHDIVVAMYHDQGHIPLKLIGFESGVNISVGMPVIRTSVDHGTAFDIAWKGIAGNESLLNAITLAERLVQ